MENKQVLHLLKFIKGAYHRFEITEDSAEVWHEFLKDEPYEEVMKRAKRHIKTSRFEPTISDMFPTKDDLQKRNQDYQIALNKWVYEGNDPAEFVFKPSDY